MHFKQKYIHASSSIQPDSEAEETDTSDKPIDYIDHTEFISNIQDEIRNTKTDSVQKKHFIF